MVCVTSTESNQLSKKLKILPPWHPRHHWTLRTRDRRQHIMSLCTSPCSGDKSALLPNTESHDNAKTVYSAGPGSLYCRHCNGITGSPKPGYAAIFSACTKQAYFFSKNSRHWRLSMSNSSNLDPHLLLLLLPFLRNSTFPLKALRWLFGRRTNPKLTTSNLCSVAG